jgi:hypothetical protein
LRIEISDPRLLPDLYATLIERVDVVVSEIDARHLEVSLLGSRRQPFQRMEIEQRLAEWRRRHPHIEVTLEADA